MKQYEHLTDRDRDILGGAVGLMALNIMTNSLEEAADALMNAVDRIIGLHMS